MTVKIRLRQQGRKNRQTYRLVIIDGRRPRDGKYVETLGAYDPFEKQNTFQVDRERLKYWLDQGAQLSENAFRLVSRSAPEVIQALQEKKHQKQLKKRSARRQRKKKDAL